MKPTLQEAPENTYAINIVSAQMTYLNQHD